MKWLDKFGSYRIDQGKKTAEGHDLDDRFDSYHLSTEDIFIPKLSDSRMFNDDWNVIGDSDLDRLMNDPYHSASNVVYVHDGNLDDMFSE